MARTQATLLALVLGIALGAVVGWCVGGLSGSQAPADSGPSLSSAAADRPQAQAPSAGPQTAQLGGARSNAARPSLSEASAPRVSDSDVERHLEQAAPREASAPLARSNDVGGIVTGKVRNGDGTPMANVVVIARRRRPDEARDMSSFGAPPPDPKDERAAVREALEEARVRARDERRAVTAADGSYAVGVPDQGAYSVSAYQAGWDFDAVGTSRTSAGGRVDFRGQPVHAVLVRVLNADGTEAESAELEVRRVSGRNNRRGTIYNWNSADPELRLLSGSHEVRAIDARLEHPSPNGVASRLASEWESVQLGSAWGQDSLELQLVPHPCILGRVLRVEDGTNGGTLMAACLELAPVDSLDEEALREEGRRVTVAADTFAFSDLEPGRYAVGLLRGRRGPVLGLQEVRIENAPVELEITADPIDRSRVLAVTAHASDGRRLSDLDFNMVWRTDDGNSNRFEPEELHEDDGTTLLVFEEDYWDGGSGRNYELIADSDELGKRRVELSPGQRSVDLEFSEPARLELAVIGYPGSGYVGRVNVGLSRIDTVNGGMHDHQSRKPDREGVARFDALEPGTYKVLLNVSPRGENRWSQSQVASREIELSPGLNSSDLELPPLYEAVIFWAEATEGAYCMMSKVQDSSEPTISNLSFGSWGGGGWGQWKQFDASGRARFTDLQAGRYQVQVMGQQYPMEIEVPCGEVVYAPQIPRGMRVQVPEGRELAGEGLQNGDLVVGVGGERFDFSEGGNAWGILQGAASAADAQVGLLVERGSSTFTVELSGAELSWNLNQGIFQQSD